MAARFFVKTWLKLKILFPQEMLTFGEGGGGKGKLQLKLKSNHFLNSVYREIPGGKNCFRKNKLLEIDSEQQPGWPLEIGDHEII